MKDDRFGSLEIKKKQSKGDSEDGDLKLNCPACGSLYSLKSNFCSNCGGDLRRINKKTVSNYKGLGGPTNSTNYSPTRPTSNTSPMNEKEYETKRAQIKQELKYRYLYIIFFLLFVLLMFLKADWFLL